MTRVFVLFFLFAASGTFGYAQSAGETGDLKRAVLMSPWFGDESGPAKWDSTRQGKQWAQVMPGHGQINYGDRFGANWDIMTINNGPTSQTRMVELGEYDWYDTFDVPYIRPLRKLEPGEKRTISVNTSGTRARDGKTFGNSTVDNQSKARIETESGDEIVDNYKPYIAAKKGHMYLMRVVDPEVDLYFLIRVDDVEHGDKLYISFKKIIAPKEPVLR